MMMCLDSFSCSSPPSKESLDRRATTTPSEVLLFHCMKTTS